MYSLQVRLQAQPNIRFFLILVGRLLSRLGMYTYTLGLPWIGYDLTGSSVVLGSIFAVEMLPLVLLLPFGGVIIDRFDRRKIMMLSDVVRTILIISIPALHLLGALQLPYLYVVGFILTVFSFFVDVSLMATIPRIVSNDSLMKSNGQFQLVENVARLGGPLLAGLLLSIYSPYTSLLFTALAYLLMAFCILLIGKVETPHLDRKINDLWNNVKSGFVYLWNQKSLRVIAINSMLGNFATALVMSTLIFFLRDTLHTNGFQTGFVYSSAGVFGIIGSLLVVPLTKKFRKGKVVTSLLLFGGGIGGLLLTVNPHWFTVGVGIGVWGGSLTTINAILNAYKQGTVANEMYGRVEGALTSVSYISIPIAGIVAGLTMNMMGGLFTHLLAAGAIVLSGLVALASPLRKI